jgi:hypothetical protein
MPKAMERKLKAEAKKKGLKGERADAYVYGTLRKTGWKPDKENDHRKENEQERRKMMAYKSKKK